MNLHLGHDGSCSTAAFDISARWSRRYVCQSVACVSALPARSLIQDFVLEIAKHSVSQLTVVPGFAAIERT